MLTVGELYDIKERETGVVKADYQYVGKYSRNLLDEAQQYVFVPVTLHGLAPNRQLIVMEDDDRYEILIQVEEC